MTYKKMDTAFWRAAWRTVRAAKKPQNWRKIEEKRRRTLRNPALFFLEHELLQKIGRFASGRKPV
jgi:hypothetical protein